MAASSPGLAFISPFEYQYEYTEDNPGELSNMFGSLFGVAVTSPEVKRKLTENWYRIVRKWYPNLHKKIYVSPPLHFYAVAYQPKPQDERPRIIPELERYGMRRYRPAIYSTVKSDESQQRILRTLRAFAQWKKMVAFIVSNMEFQNYLNKTYEWAEPDEEYAKTMPKPNIKLKAEEGEIDILLIDKVHGIFVLEVKSFGDEDEIWDLVSPTEQKKFAELHDKFRSKVGVQVEKGKLVIRKLLSDLDQKIDIRGGFAMVNVKRSYFDQALEEFQDPDLSDLLRRIEVKDVQSLSDITFCCEDLPKKHVPGEEPMTEEIFRRMDSVWSNLLKKDGGGEGKAMSDDLYERVVARFAGPLTTVKIYTEKTYPRVKVEIIPREKKSKKHRPTPKMILVPEQAMSMADAARIMARRFSELVLLQDQIEVLQRNEDFVHIEGPPGTGKTLVLLLRILIWLEEGHMVWILSLAPPSRSVSHVLLEQIKKMIELHYKDKQVPAQKLLDRLRLFMLTRAENTLDEEFFKRVILKFRTRAMKDPAKVGARLPRTVTTRANQPLTPEHDCKVCLALDETGMAGKGLSEFFKWVAKLHKEGAFRGPEFNKGLSVWSASVERVGRPQYCTAPGQTDQDKFGIIWKLQLPLRCPPSVQRALILVQPNLDQSNVCCFTEEMTLSHPAKQKGTANREVYAADGLPVFLIAHGSHKDVDRDIWFCHDCGKELADYLKNVLHIGEEECVCQDKEVYYDIKEKNCPDCNKLTKGSLAAADLPLKYNDVMIVATQRSFKFSVPVGGFALALVEENLKVAINTTREEGAAPIPDDDVILIVDVTAIHGLERAIIIVVPDVNPPPPLPSRYRGMMYPEPPFLPDPREKTGQKLYEQERGVRAETTVYSPPVRHNRHFKEAIDKKKDVTVLGGGQVEVEDEATEDRTEDTESGSPTSDYSMPEQYSDRKERCADVVSPADAAGRDAEYSTAVSQPSGSMPVSEAEVPYTYNDAFSRQEISAALASLHPQSRQDVFYIGSRAVCQMILIHLGKNTRQQDPDREREKAMESGCNTYQQSPDKDSEKAMESGCNTYQQSPDREREKAMESGCNTYQQSPDREREKAMESGCNTYQQSPDREREKAMESGCNTYQQSPDKDSEKAMETEWTDRHKQFNVLSR